MDLKKASEEKDRLDIEIQRLRNQERVVQDAILALDR